MKKILIRSDASASAGAGHFMRSVALGQYLKSRGSRIRFVTVPWTQRLTHYLEKQDFEVRCLDLKESECGSAKDISRLLEELEDGFDWAVLDSYYFDDAFRTAVCRSGVRLLVIDDRKKLPDHGDLVLNPTFRSYSVHPNPSYVLLSGPGYILIRRELAELPKKPKADLKNILVTLGGSAQMETLQKIVAGIQKIDSPSFDVKIILGFSEELPHPPLMRGGRHRIEWQKADLEMAPFYDWADIAVCAAGGTCGELCFFGVVGIVGALSDEQADLGDVLEQRGLFRSIGRFEKATPATIARALNILLQDRGLLARMRRRALSLVDGKGAQRVGEEMCHFEVKKESLGVK